MECPLLRLLISSRSVSKHGHHMQFLFLIGRFLKNLLLWNCLGKTKYVCVYCRMSKRSRVGQHSFFFFFFFFYYWQNRKWSFRFRYFIFEISSKSSFVEAVLWQVAQFFYLLCSQFWQKASGWINKTLLLIKQQKWLSEFCVKICKN